MQVTLASCGQTVAACASGYYCTLDSLSTRANPCQPGTYSALGSASCANCSAGFVCPSLASVNSTMVACEPGRYSEAGWSACLTCTNAGFFCPGASAPITCPPGTYSEAGWSVCMNCSAGYACPSSASVNSTMVACGAGQYSLSGWSACSNCSGGKLLCTTFIWKHCGIAHIPLAVL